MLCAAIATLGAAAAMAGEITLFEYPDFAGRRITLRGVVSNFDPNGFNDRAASMVIRDGYWELCSDAYFRGRCATFGPGEYRNLQPALTDTISSAREVGGAQPAPPPPPPQARPPAPGFVESSPRIELWERREFGGRSIVLTSGAPDFERIGFNDRADAAVVYSGVWRLCEHAGLGGQCREFGPGRYNDLGYLGRTRQLGGHRRRLGRWPSSAAASPSADRAPPRDPVRVSEFRRAKLCHREQRRRQPRPHRLQRPRIVDPRRGWVLVVLHRRQDSRAPAAPSVPATTHRCRGRSTTGYRRAAASTTSTRTTPHRRGTRRADRMAQVDDIAGLRRILRECRSIAVVGLSANWYRPSYFAAKYMQDHGYDIFPVNPNYSEVLGRKCYPSLRDIREKVDIVDCFRKSEEIVPMARDAVAIGARVLWMQLGIRNDEAARIASEAGLDVVMDHCVKIEHARILGGLNWAGVNTGVISSRRAA